MTYSSKMSLGVGCFILQSYISLAIIEVPFISNMQLGRTYDYSKSLVGNDIYSKEDQGNAIEEQTKDAKFYSTYEIIKKQENVRDVLDISGQLSLQVMAGVVDIEGKGSYLKSSVESEDVVQVLAQIQYETIVKTLPRSAKRISNWDDEKTRIGEHYIYSVYYGGYLIASMKMIRTKSESTEEIKASVSASLKASKKFNLDVKGMFEKLEKDTKDISTMTITFSSTQHPETMPIDRDTLLKNIEEFTKQEKALGNKGVPIKVGLKDQGDLKNTPLFLANTRSQITGKLNRLAERYLDLKTTSNEITRSLEHTQLSKTEEKIFGKFNARIWKLNEVFFQTIDNLNLNEKDGLKTAQFDKALEMYGNQKVVGYYLRAFKRLKRKYPLYKNSQGSYERPSNVLELQKIVESQNKLLISIKKRMSGDRVAFSFEHKDTGDYLIARGAPTEMREITACFSAKSQVQNFRQTFLSYATTKHPLEFVVATEEEKLIVTRRGTERKFGEDFGMNSGNWHDWCFSWDDSGKIELFKNGKKQEETKKNVAAGTMIDAGGLWMVGQAQGTLGEKLNPEESFQGNIANVNIFEKSNEIFGKEASRELTCPENVDYSNNFPSWRDFRYGKVGDLQVIDGPACSDMERW